MRPEETELLIRAVVPIGRAERARSAVVVDLPVDQEVVERIRDKTGMRAGDVTIRTVTPARSWAGCAAPPRSSSGARRRHPGPQPPAGT